MSVIDQLVEIVPRLGVDEQRRVLEIAIALRDKQNVPPLAFPLAGAGDGAWDELSAEVHARSAIVLEREKQRLQALGLIDEHWNELTDELPPDMRASSQTSVET
jgi:hypothetical protein